MPCEKYNQCNFASIYKQGLEIPDKEALQYFLTVCQKEGSENCPYEEDDKPNIVKTVGEA